MLGLEPSIYGVIEQPPSCWSVSIIGTWLWDITHWFCCWNHQYVPGITDLKLLILNNLEHYARIQKSFKKKPWLTRIHHHPLHPSPYLTFLKQRVGSILKSFKHKMQKKTHKQLKQKTSSFFAFSPHIPITAAKPNYHHQQNKYSQRANTTKWHNVNTLESPAYVMQWYII